MLSILRPAKYSSKYIKRCPLTRTLVSPKIGQSGSKSSQSGPILKISPSGPLTQASPLQPELLPQSIPAEAPNRNLTWSLSQRPKAEAMTGPRFEQTDMAAQPNPSAAIELIAREPVRIVQGRIARCDGGGGPLGHPAVFINIDKPKPQPCGYCGLRFQQEGHNM
ncbi:Lactobacillus shifted protein isoform B [Neolecta irregularis DAH-3]|uniref:Lactobacillus shifted protein isoform A n=1 Tax=Neolecta irregularis (strain DAH-3) TaxID=1198029 RepID=A0A1U7LJW3_NEOID|nr:Lactobacillus shifted protein isoform A [Neolecta irregularis DAH-3]OLL22930.1 Lactobacillus shifted protein isoform B [Neolecta irregularis DAH-3]|eukprot:OLL22929.1 Lactobacillus shifted protein isoform A [Neolecta irregularis DAH-3]